METEMMMLEASKRRVGNLKLNKQIIKILYFRYLNICTVHKQREINKTEFIIAKAADFRLFTERLFPFGL